MPKLVSQAEFDAVLRAVSRFPEGAGIEDIVKALELDVPRRTLQRRLALLVEQQQLIVEGRARGSRYRVAPDHATVVPQVGRIKLSGRAPATEIYVPVSAEGEAGWLRRGAGNRRRHFLLILHNPID